MRNREEYPDHTHTRSAPSSEARGLPLGGSMRCAGPHGHTTWVGVWAAWFRRGVFRGCRAGLRHTFRVAGGRAGDPAPSTVWCAGHACALCAPCAHPLARRPRVLVARQHATSVPTLLLRGREEADGSRLGPPADGVLSPCTGARRAACWRSFGGQNKRGASTDRREPGGGLVAMLGACRGVGGDSPGP